MRVTMSRRRGSRCCPDGRALALRSSSDTPTPPLTPMASPSVERLVTTPAAPEELRTSEEINQTPCRASKATDGSLAAVNGPP